MEAIKFNKELKGERIVLKEHPITFEHSKAALELINKNREIFEKYLVWAEYTKKPEDHFKGFLSKLEGKMDSGERAEYIITLDNKYIGQIGFFDVCLDKEAGEIGYWLDKDYVGNGYMNEAINILEKHIFGLGFNKIYLKHSSHNEASKKVIERADYKLEGVLRDFEKFDGIWRDDLIYSKLKSEYNGEKK